MLSKEKKTFIYNLVKFSGKSTAILDDYSNNNLIRLCYISSQTKVILNFNICNTTDTFLQISKSLQPEMIIILTKTLEKNLFDFLIEIRNIFSKIFLKYLIKNMIKQTQTASKISKFDFNHKILDSGKKIIIFDFRFFETNLTKNDEIYQNFVETIEKNIIKGTYF